MTIRLGPAILLLLLAMANSRASDVTVRPALAYSHTFGGHGADGGTAVALDAAGNAFVAGTTTSLDFPIKNGFQQRIVTPVRVSTDNGKNWSTPAIGAPVYAVAGSPNQKGILFAGTSNGMYKSADGGKTWNVLSLDTHLLVNAVVVDSVNASVVYAGTSGGPFKSEDGGATWRLTDSLGNVIILVSHSARPTTLFAGIGFGVGARANSPTLYRSTGAGVNWYLLSSSPIGAFALVSDPSNPDVLYAGGGADTPAIYKTSDSGDTWTKLAELPLANSTFGIAASATSVFAATDNGVVRSIDGGITWTATTITAPADNVAIDPNNPQVVYANAGGIFVSMDSGVTWSSVLPIRQNVQTISVMPTTPSTVFVGEAPGECVFVTKWRPDGKEMLYSTYLCGSYYDFPTGIAVDSQGFAYVTGYTYSTDFPVTASAVQSKNPGPYNAFLAKIAADGSKLLYSTYLGGSSGDAALAIALNGVGNAYLTGYAGSDNFPVTVNAVQPRLDQNCAIPAAPGFDSRAKLGDAFVAKIDTLAGALLYATYLGGACADKGLGIAADAAGNAYVVGATASPDFPTTKGAQTSMYGGGPNMGFLTKLSPQGGMSYSTFLGGAGNDVAQAVTLDQKGDLYITGSTFGFDQLRFGSTLDIRVLRFEFGPLLVVPGFRVATGGAAYVLKIDSATMSNLYLTYIGGSFGLGKSLAVDAAGKAWVAGSTDSLYVSPSTPFPVVHPFQAETGQGFVSEISTDGSTLLFSSLIDSVSGIGLDSAGNAFVVGISNQSDFCKSFYSCPLLVRIDSAVPSLVTVEEPQRLVPRTSGFYPLPGIAAGEILVLTGTGLGPSREVGAQWTPAGTLATSIGGTSVMFDGVPAPLLSVQSEKVVCIAPFELGLPFGTTTIQVSSNGSQSNSIVLPLTETQIEVLAVANEDGIVNSPGHPAAPGSVVTVYAAGFGPTTPRSVDGQINGRGTLDAAPVRVHIADQDAQILYAGPAPAQVAGITQINFVVSQLPPGQYTAYVGWGHLGQSILVSDFNAAAINIGPQ